MAYYATYMPNELGERQKVVINAGVGFVLPYYGETAPPGTLACDGSEISREAYKELFAVLGTKAGAGDGSTTFNLPDLRGQFVRGTGGNAAALGERQGDAIRQMTGTMHNILCSAVQEPDGVFAATTGVVVKAMTGGAQPLTARSLIFNVSKGGYPTADENRPVNVALLWCIIYE